MCKKLISIQPKIAILQKLGTNFIIRTIKSISLLGIGTIGGAIGTFLTQLIIARKIGLMDYGTFASLLVLITTITPLAGFGVSQYWLKEFGKEGWAAWRWIPVSIRFAVSSTLIVFLALFFWAIFGRHDSYVRNIIICLSFNVPSQVTLTLMFSKLQIEENYINYAVWQTAPPFIRFFLILIFSFLFPNWINGLNVSVIYALISICVIAVGCWGLRGIAKGCFALKGHGERRYGCDVIFPNVKELIKNIWPFGIANFAFLIYYQIDVYLIKYFKGASDAGVYHVAVTIMSATFLFPQVVTVFLLPKMHRWASHDYDRFYQVYRCCNMLMLIIGLIVMFAIFLLAPWGISFLFGDHYKDSVPLLKILALTIPIVFVASSVGLTLTTQKYMGIKVIYMGLAAIMNFLLNLYFISNFGAIGAAIVTVLCNIFLLFSYYNTAKRKIFNLVKKNDWVTV